MKKIYITPAVEINESMASQMMALSIIDETADSSDVLVGEGVDLDIWEQE